jgi:hypothetical protein
VADHVKVAGGVTCVSLATGSSGVVGVLAGVDWSAMGATVTTLTTRHSKCVEPLKPALSVAVMVTSK